MTSSDPEVAPKIHGQGVVAFDFAPWFRDWLQQQSTLLDAEVAEIEKTKPDMFASSDEKRAVLSRLEQIGHLRFIVNDLRELYTEDHPTE